MTDPPEPWSLDHICSKCAAPRKQLHIHMAGLGTTEKSYSLPPVDLTCAGLLLTSLPCHQHMQTQPNVTTQCNSQSTTGPGICGSWICRLHSNARHSNLCASWSGFQSVLSCTMSRFSDNTHTADGHVDSRCSESAACSLESGQPSESTQHEGR